MVIGVLEILASLSLFGRWRLRPRFGILAVALAAIAALLAIHVSPLLGLADFGISLWIIHGLALDGQDVRAAGQ